MKTPEGVTYVKIWTNVQGVSTHATLTYQAVEIQLEVILAVVYLDIGKIALLALMLTSVLKERSIALRMLVARIWVGTLFCKN